MRDCARKTARLRQRLGLPSEKTSVPSIVPTVHITDSPINSKSSPDEKVGLFRSLFRGREDVYAVRWEGRNGKTGYSPAYRKVWSNPFQRKPDEPKEYFPLTAQVIHDHLTGRLTAGVYPLLTDETCWFLAADFDKATWQDDVLAFLQTCADWRIPAALERSRSGRGGHVWVFFDAPLPASLAGKLGAAILTRTMECRHQLGLDSYDRLFPSQDTMPKGGFGNLIALPLQRQDGHHPIIVTQCGPIRYRVNAKEQARARPFKHIVFPRPTNFRLPPTTEKPEMHALYAALATDKSRNDLITVDLVRAVKAGRSPVLLTERTSHVDEFAVRLAGLVKHVVVLKGGLGAKQRRTVADHLAAIPNGEERVLLATGRYIGEGFDDARLDTLFLAMPISWRGTLQQYVGRLHRSHDNKREVVVYDYVDGTVLVLSAMYTKRLRGYEAVGYEISDGL
ncbi:MAG: hypothetical protein KGJ88_00705 [Verrucomicrobiota bacterium]|nr:hypothetical protein [Verrucomicrobiota bacterium]